MKHDKVNSQLQKTQFFPILISPQKFSYIKYFEYETIESVFWQKVKCKLLFGTTIFENFASAYKFYFEISNFSFLNIKTKRLLVLCNHIILFFRRKKTNESLILSL